MGAVESSLLKITRCAVCLEIVRPDLVECVNGHLMCSECKGELKECPTCSDQFSQSKPSNFIYKVLELLPSRCKYKDCPNYLQSEEGEHEKYCGFKPTKCKMCEWKGPRKDILTHVQQKHTGVNIFTEEDKSVMLHQNLLLPIKRTSFTLYIISEQFFWNQVSIDSLVKEFSVTFHFVPNGKPTENIFANIGLTCKESNFACKVKLNLDPDIDPKENMIVIPWSIFIGVIREKGKLSYESYLSKK